MHLCTLVTAFDALLGEPPSPLHPTVWLGHLVATLEKALYFKSGVRARLQGTLLVATVIGVSAGAGLAIEILLTRLLPSPLAILAVSAAASLTIAPRSLAAHALPVLRELCRLKLPSARSKLSMIVGRDTATLGRTEISRAATEAVAESLGDGVIAPLLLFALFGLPGAFAYRAANTMDSMLGHKDERYLHFGWAAARFDDLLNFIPARLVALPAITLAASLLLGLRQARACLRSAISFHGLHPSPSAGWFEAAFAGALGVRLGGTNFYEGARHDYPVMNPAGRKARARDILQSMRLMALSTALSAIALDAAALCVALLMKSI